jgi:ribosomal protein L2
MSKKARFPVGLEFTLKRGKVIKDCKIVDILTTTNIKGEVVKIEYDTTRP